jgi:hypothetical protein
MLPFLQSAIELWQSPVNLQAIGPTVVSGNDIEFADARNPTDAARYSVNAATPCVPVKRRHLEKRAMAQPDWLHLPHSRGLPGLSLSSSGKRERGGLDDL